MLADLFARLDADLAAIRASLARRDVIAARCEARTVALEAGLARLAAERDRHDRHDQRGGA